MHFCPTESGKRSAVLESGPGELPQSPDLSGAAFTEEGYPHFALRIETQRLSDVGGWESLAGFGDHFSLVDKKDKIYQKRKTTARMATYFATTDYSPRREEDAKTGLRFFPAPFTVENEVEQLLINRFVPRFYRPVVPVGLRGLFV